ncbi:MAG: diacylglycerol kinase [Rhizobium sp.]|nr:diacylglycerol kinase [Rhizobium sp.]
MMEEPLGKKTGLAHLFAAASYSVAGFWRALNESAFRHEIIFYLVGLILFYFVHATLAEYLILTILFLMIFAFEALNTAIEELVDRVSPEVSRTGKHAKDLGSFSVACALVAAGLFIAWVVFT